MPACSRSRAEASAALSQAALPYVLAGIAVVAGRMWRSGWLDEPADWGLGVTFLVWIGILVAFDVVFLTLALWTFEPLMTE